ncbi:MAG: endonuclease V, partial [Candidatus Omnitrophica bacterium]|nr:endonuclease V [Candidatus Omnitrophota bacterium]
RKDVKPVFVSPGHKTNLNKSIEIIMNLTDRFRIPQPLRYAHKKSKELLK